MKHIVVLGLSGSIGTQTEAVISRHRDMFQLVGFSVWSHTDELDHWLTEHPYVKMVAVQHEHQVLAYQPRFPHITWVYGTSGLCQLASLSEADVVVTAIVGFAGLAPTLAAIQAGKDIALANKETLVVAGEIIQQAIAAHHVRLFPIDSEHSALTQCLRGETPDVVERLIITASGGPFRTKTREELQGVTVQDALNHPTWSMGSKISIDSATMVNKGLEVIEAHFLFGIPYDRIQVLIHPQSIVHSLVEFVDGSMKAQVGVATMEIPILYALSGHQHVMDTAHRFDFFTRPTWTFEQPNFKRFPALALAYEVGRCGGTYPCVFNAANEVAVHAFLHGQLPFDQIETVIAHVVNHHTKEEQHDIEQLYRIDRETRRLAHDYIATLGE